MKKLVLICGASRTGKTSTAKHLHDKFGYNVLKLDAIINSINVISNDKIDRENFNDSRVKRILVSLIKNIKSDIVNRGYKYIIEGCCLSPKLINEAKDEIAHVIDITPIYLVNRSSAEELELFILNNQKSYDWTSFIEREELMERCKKIFEVNRLFKVDCVNLKLNVVYVENKNLNTIYQQVETLLEE